MARARTAARGYDAAWQRLRARYLRQHPRCQVCGQASVDVDHVVSVREAPGLRLVWGNLVALCHIHHSFVTAGFDSGRIKGACDAAGNPLDPGHPWAAAQPTHLVAASTLQDSLRRPEAAAVLRRLKVEWLARWSDEGL